MLNSKGERELVYVVLIDEIMPIKGYDRVELARVGGDYIKLLDWLEEEGIVDTGYFFHIHSQNSVGVENMRRIIEHNNWREVKSI